MTKLLATAAIAALMMTGSAFATGFPVCGEDGQTVSVNGVVVTVTKRTSPNPASTNGWSEATLVSRMIQGQQFQGHGFDFKLGGCTICDVAGGTALCRADEQPE